jgi:hypothetical protein
MARRPQAIPNRTALMLGVVRSHPTTVSGHNILGEAS